MKDEYLSGDQVRIILHISKRKAAWLFQHGYIPCVDSGKKTHRYLVRRSDLKRFIKNVEKHPERFHTPIGLFTAAHPHASDDFPKELPAEFRPWLEVRFSRYHLALTLDEVADISGYSAQTISRWVRNGKIRSVQTQGDIIVPKTWLVDFYCSTGYRMPGMCKKHKKLLRKFFEQ